MDDADRAQAIEERNLERAITAARGVPAGSARWEDCCNCGELLAEARRHIGLCVACKTRREQPRF